MPDLGQGLFQLPEPDADDILAWRDLQAGAFLLNDEPGNRQDEPDGGGEGDEDAETPIIGLGTGVHVYAEQDTDDDDQDEDLADALNTERHVAQPATLHLVLAVVVSLGDLTLGVSTRSLFQLRGVARQRREGRRPVGQGELVADETNNVQTNAGLPFRRLMHAEPGKTDAEGNNGPEDENPAPPGPKVSVRANDDEERSLDGEANAIGEENDAVHVTIAAGEGEKSRIFGRGLRQEVLEGRRAEIEQCETIGTDVKGIP